MSAKDYLPIKDAEQRAGWSIDSAFGIAAFFAVHIALALVMRSWSLAGTAHAVCTALLGLWYAMRGGRPERVAYIAAYIAGSEVLWRMDGADVFWEFGKYSLSAMFLVALLRSGRMKGSTSPLLYFVLLLPSASLTLMGLDWDHARRQLSFNLSGPLALMLAVWFFSNMKMSKAQLHRLFIAFLGPVAGVAGVTISGIATAAFIQFTTSSNNQTSGGFGPNQVAAILGLAAFLCFFYLLHDKTSPGVKALLIASIIVFATQSAMTFSRGGLYAAAGSALLAGIFLVREKRGMARLLQVAPVLFVVVVYVVVPQVVAFTGGTISERFKKTSLTRRGDLMEGDLRIWEDNPVFGVGPGMGADLRGRYMEHVASHTEFTRLLSEHGLFGVMALLALLAIALRAFLSADGPGSKALTVSLMTWSFLFMFSNGMRLVAPSFTFGLACATILGEKRAVRRVRSLVRYNGNRIDSPSKEPWRDPGLAEPAL